MAANRYYHFPINVPIVPICSVRCNFKRLQSYSILCGSCCWHRHHGTHIYKYIDIVFSTVKYCIRYHFMTHVARIENHPPMCIRVGVYRVDGGGIYNKTFYDMEFIR